MTWFQRPYTRTLVVLDHREDADEENEENIVELKEDFNLIKGKIMGSFKIEGKSCQKIIVNFLENLRNNF